VFQKILRCLALLLLFFNEGFGRVPVILSDAGIEYPKVDALGLFDVRSIGADPVLWRQVAYNDYLYLVARVGSAFDSSVLYDMALFFLGTAGVCPRSRRNDHNGALIALRTMKIIELGHMKDADRLLEMVEAAERLDTAEMAKLRLYYLLYQNSLTKALTHVDKMLVHVERGKRDENVEFWNNARLALNLILASKEDARTMVAMQKELMSEGRGEFINGILPIVQSGSLSHLKHVTPLTLKIILRFCTVNARFLSSLPYKFYSMVYQDEVWHQLDADLRLRVVEHLVRAGALKVQTLLEEYSKFKGLKGDQPTMQRAVLYNQLLLKPVLSQLDVLYQFVQLLIQDHLLLVMAPVLRGWFKDIAPSEETKDLAPLALIVYALNDDDVSAKWFDVVRGSRYYRGFPILPLYILLRSSSLEQDEIVALFQEWWGEEKDSEFKARVLYTLATAIPWLPKEVNVFVRFGVCSPVEQDAELIWAMASENTFSILSTLVRNGMTADSAMCGAMKIHGKRWGRRLACEYLLHGR